MESARTTLPVPTTSAESSVASSSKSTSVSTSPSSSVSDATMSTEYAKLTTGDGIISGLAQEEPEICASLASLHTSHYPAGPARRESPSEVTSKEEPGPKRINGSETQDVVAPIPLSRLFDFDKDDQGSDQIVLNESERQYQQKLRREFDAAFEGADLGGSGDHIHDSDDDDDIRVDDDDDYSYGNRPPPPPPPPVGPPSIKHLPSVLDEAQSTYLQIDDNIYRGLTTGNSPVNDCLPCQCKYNPHRDPRGKACGADCINRNLLVECIEDDCPCGSYCLNRRFQTKQNAKVDVIRTEKKGFGLRAMEGLAPGAFVMEYIGEVLPHANFVKRTREYSAAGVEHFYFMSLQADEVIDATKKGCMARFINHSCNPNCHLEKWVVGSKLRIGIFTIKRVAEGDELTFDYQFERYGAEAQKCYCGEANCTGFIGGNKRSSATRLDNYNADDVVDEDEIDLENEMSRRIPRKDKGRDGDYEDEYDDRKITRGIDDPILMEKLARIMFMKPKVQKSKRLLAKLMATTERACLRRFLVLHGLVILKTWLRHYKDEPDIITGIMFVLPNIPLLSRNAIEDSLIEEAVRDIADGPDCPAKGKAQAVLDQWKGLKSTYRIPKAKKVAPPSASDPANPSVDEPATFMSPAESNVSGSAEGQTKRQFEEDEPDSPPPAAEKRSRFDSSLSDQPSVSEQGPLTVDSPAGYRSSPYGSPRSQEPYAARHEPHRTYESYARAVDGYTREGRSEYYGRLEPYSREDAYSRPGEHSYSRSGSRDRVHSYGGYDRARYEGYRGDRDRERDRYHEPYRDREYDRDYRRPRDLRDPVDVRETRDIRFPETDIDREPRERSLPFSPMPMSPVNGDTVATPTGSAGRPSLTMGWAGPSARSISPAKSSLRSSPAHIHTKPVPAREGTETPDAVTPATSVANLLALQTLAESKLTASAAASRNNSPPASSPIALGPALTTVQTTPTAAPRSEDGDVSVKPEAQAAGYRDEEYRSRTTSGAEKYPYYSYREDYHGSSSHRRDHRDERDHRDARDYADYYRHPSSHQQRYSATDYRPRSVAHPHAGPSNYPPPMELPPNWSKAKDPEGRVYYYNEITRATQWDPPRRQIPDQNRPVPPPAAAAAVPVLRTASPEPRKPVNIDGFTQEQIQEVIGRAFDKLKQKNMNGSGSAGTSVHDVETPGVDGRNRSPLHRSSKPLKAMTEKDLKAALSATVVKNMAKFKIKLGSSEAFKKHARRITHLIADKETRSKTFKAGELTEITMPMKNKIKRFVRDYMTKLFKKQSSSSSTSQPVNGTRTGSGSHVIVMGVDDHVGGFFPIKHPLPATFQQRPARQQRPDDKGLGYGDVDVDDELDVKYGEGEDDDEGEEDEDDDEGGVAAVPSVSAELPV